MKTNIKIILSLLLIIWGCTNISLKKTNIIRIKGSDTMQLLISRWIEAYMKDHSDISIYSEGGGTVVGIQALIKGEIDISAASRPLRPHEARMLAEKYGKLGMSILTAKDAISIYVNPNNPVQNLTIAQIKQIFTGKISNWKEVGGHDTPIQVLTRSPNSGTYLYFKEHILEDQPYTVSAKTMVTYTAMVQYISENKYSIGFGGIVFSQGINHCKLNGIAPTEENVRNDIYPIIRYLYLYTIDTPRGQIKDFIDWVLKDGQKIVKESGLIPLWEVD